LTSDLASPRAEARTRAIRSRLSGGVSSLIDNALYSLGTVVFAIAAGRKLGYGEFGLFSVASWLVMVLSLTVRVGVMECVGADSRRRRHPIRSSLGAGIGASILVAVVPLAVVVVDPGQRMVWIAAAVATLGVAAQDVFRYGAFFEDRVGLAIASDAFCAALGIAVIFAPGFSSPAAVLLAWGGAGILGAAAIAAALGVMPQIAAGFRVLNQLRGQVARYCFDAIINFGSFVLGMSLAAVVGGVDVAAGLNGARILLTPAQVLVTGFGLHLFRSVASGKASVPTASRGLRWLPIGCAIPLGYGLVVLLVPAWVLEQLFGASAVAVRQALPWFVVAFSGVGGAVLAKLVLKLWQRATAVVMIGVASAPIFLALPALASLPFGIAGAAFGVAVGFLAALLAGTIGVIRGPGPAVPAPSEDAHV